jgi:hypothetical protein
MRTYGFKSSSVIHRIFLMKKLYFCDMKTLNFFLVPFLLVGGCNRVEPEPEPLRTTLVILSPNPDYTLDSDTATVSLKITLSKDYPSVSVKIAHQTATKTSSGIYSLFLNFTPFSGNRIAVPVDIFSDENRIAVDTLRFVRFRLTPQSIYSMTNPRSNHASVVVGEHIVTFGGVESYSGNAINSLEIFNTVSGLSEIQATSLSFSRSGHGIVYNSVTDSLYVFGGGKKQYAIYGDDQLIPAESVKFSALNGAAATYTNPGFYQDFGWYYDNSKLYIQGGSRKNFGLTNTYFKIAVSEAFRKELQVSNNLSLSEQVLVQDPLYIDYLYFVSSDFGRGGVSNITGFVKKSTGAIYFEPIQVRGARNEHTGIDLDGGFVLIGGGFYTETEMGTIRNDFELQDLKTGKSYIISTKLATGRASHTMCKIGNNIYILGGYDQTQSVIKSIEKFTYQF